MVLIKYPCYYFREGRRTCPTSYFCTPYAMIYPNGGIDKWQCKPRRLFLLAISSRAKAIVLPIEPPFAHLFLITDLVAQMKR